MGVNTRIGKVASATYSAPASTYAAPSSTYSAPTQTGAALVITWNSNEPTAGTANTIADGAGVSDAEMAQTLQNLDTQLNKNVVDIADTNTELAALAVDVADAVAELAALAVDVAANKTAIVASGADNAAMLAKLNEGE